MTKGIRMAAYINKRLQTTWCKSPFRDNAVQSKSP
jgi:hypothetical protein